MQSNSSSQTRCDRAHDSTSAFFGSSDRPENLRAILNCDIAHNNQSTSPYCAFQVSPTEVLSKINKSTAEAVYSIYERFL
jgi:hypothetical protein